MLSQADVAQQMPQRAGELLAELSASPSNN
jgi:hypothetical protein